MFNNYTNKYYHANLPSTIKIEEKRAPTDDSIKLYEEIREKVQKELISRIQVNDNSFNITFDFYQSFGGNFEIVCKYSINGSNYETIIRNNIINLNIKYNGNKMEMFACFFEENVWSQIYNDIKKILTMQFVKSDSFKDIEKLFMRS